MKTRAWGASVKQRVKRIRGVYELLAWYRSFTQERRIRLEDRLYESRAQALGIRIDDDLESTRRRLVARLVARGIDLRAKRIGDLHVVYASIPVNWDKHNIPPGLEKLGRVTTFYMKEWGFDPDSSGWCKIRSHLDSFLLDFVRSVHSRQPIDAFVSYLTGWHVAPETIREIGNLGIFTCGFHWDDRLWFRGRREGGRWSGPAALASAYDLNLTNAPRSVVKYAIEGGIAIFWPEAANPDLFRPLNLPFDFDVSFVGACYGQRPKLVEYLRDHGIKVEAFGPGWPNGFLTEGHMVEVYSRSRINLGFSGIGYSQNECCLKGRDFEVPMCGALYLTGDHPDLHLVYDVGNEIVTYKDKEDLVRKVRYLLSHPDECDRIRCAARQRCLRDHTWERRFRDLFAFAGLLRE